MSSVTPPPPPNVSAALLAPVPSALVPQPPPSLLSLNIGAKINAQLAGLDNQGRILVETPLGQFALQTNISLPASGPVQLQVQTLGRQVMLLITAIHGKQPAAALHSLSGLLPPTLPGLTNSPTKTIGTLVATPGTAAPKITGAASQSTVTNAAVAPTPMPLTQGATLGATLLQPVTVLFGNPSADSPQVVTTSPQPGQMVQSVAALTASRSGQAGKVMPISHSPTPLSSPVTVPTGSTVIVRVISVQSGATTPQPLPQAGLINIGMMLNAAVIGSSAPNQTVVQTHVGPVALATTTSLPANTQINLEITQLPHMQAAARDHTVIHRLGQIIAESRQWPALKESVLSLQDTYPTTAQQLINAVLPKPDAAFSANVLLFLFALRAGDVRSWLGDAPARALGRLKPGLLGRLRDDFSGLGRLVEEPAGPEGRSLPIPLANGPDIEQIQLWLRRIEEGKKEEEENRMGPGTRFVVDVNLSKLGHMQLDGFVQDGTKHFDLIVRTDTRLSNEIQNGIRSVFEGANETTGVTGGLTFQSAPANFVDTTKNSVGDGLGLMV